jgi:hypothetical protein
VNIILGGISDFTGFYILLGHQHRFLMLAKAVGHTTAGIYIHTQNSATE